MQKERPMTRSLESLTDALLSAARSAGADAADALAVDGTSLSVNIRAGALEQAERSEAVELGLRVLVGRRQACVSVSDISQATITAVAERAVAMAREAPEDPFIGLADPAQIAAAWDIAALELADDAAEPDAQALEQDARRAEVAALAAGGITQVEAAAGYSARRMHLATSNGFAGGYGRTSRSFSAVAFTGEGTGMERDWAAESRTFQADLPAPEESGRLAAERALSRLGARKPKTGACPVLFDERVAASLIGHLLSAVNGSAVARGASWARGLLGKQVLPEPLSVIEDPLRPRMGASRPFDGEGLASIRRVIVDKGVLTGWTLDLATGRKLGMASTASASRGTQAPPSPGTTNIDLTPGSASRDDLIRDMGTGLLITSLIGSTVNPTTGDYSRGASGFWVENGQITHAVNEVTVAGNLTDMLRRITPANDARAHLSTRVPSLLVEGLTLAGA
jgi:PmbA protein